MTIVGRLLLVFSIIWLLLVGAAIGWEYASHDEYERFAFQPTDSFWFWTWTPTNLLAEPPSRYFELRALRAFLISATPIAIAWTIGIGFFTLRRRATTPNAT